MAYSSWLLGVEYAHNSLVSTSTGGVVLYGTAGQLIFDHQEEEETVIPSVQANFQLWKQVCMALHAPLSRSRGRRTTELPHQCINMEKKGLSVLQGPSVPDRVQKAGTAFRVTVRGGPEGQHSGGVCPS